MLRLLKLDNFNKYEKEFLADSSHSANKSISKLTDLKIDYQSVIKDYISEEHEDKKPEKKTEEVFEEIDDSESSLDNKDEYESVDPKTLEEAEEKINQ